MISQIHIKNFKSIVDLNLDLGRVNLFIGENGSGKSNILEAVAFLSSTARFGIQNYYNSKGVRTTTAELLFSAFNSDIENIEIDFIIDDFLITSIYEYYNVDTNNFQEEGWKEISGGEFFQKYQKFLQENIEYIKDYSKYLYVDDLSIEKVSFSNVEFVADTPIEIKERIIKSGTNFEKYYKYRYCRYLINYMIFSPDVSFLRKFEEEGQIKPLGARGEGLFSLLKSMTNDNGSLQHIKEHLELIDWYEDFAIPNDLMSNEYRISIKDRFIDSELKYLDQRSANEGFLFLLFYIVLFSSKKTPQFFAIDNIEASFNPKLCAKLINTLVDLAKKNDKQVLMTTHNPATLDGLNLNDPEQRLFVVERNLDGHTIATRITEKPKISTPMKLSEMWTKGFLGGLPENF